MSKSVEDIAVEIINYNGNIFHLRERIKEALTAERKRAEDAEAENKRLREALRYIYDNCESEQEKWAEQTAKEALGGEA